ncbi:MAG: hypothetical protein CUN55_18585, partial [Phototrophicales bacterium]
SFLSSHSDYKIEAYARHMVSKETAAHIYTLGNAAYWTIAPSVFLFPIYGSTSFGLANLALVTNNIVIASINSLFNTLYEYEGLEHQADRWMTTWYISMNAIIPFYHAITMRVVDGMGGPYGAVFKRIFLVMNLGQLALSLGLDQLKRYLMRKVFLLD